MYSTSRGRVHICDTRERSTFGKKSCLKLKESGEKAVPFGSNVCAAKFVEQNYHQIISRTNTHVSLWDIRKSGYLSEPHLTMHLNNYLSDSITELASVGATRDNNFLATSPCGQYILTGDYGSQAHIIAKNG